MARRCTTCGNSDPQVIGCIRRPGSRFTPGSWAELTAYEPDELDACPECEGRAA